jgi:hypothetical protein
VTLQSISSCVILMRYKEHSNNFYHCTVHSDNYRVRSPTNSLFIKLEKASKLALKFTLNLLLHVSVYDHHQGAYAGAWLKLYLCQNSVKSYIVICNACKGMTQCVHTHLHTRRSPTQSETHQMLYWYNWFSWWWARGCSKHVENWNKNIEKRIVRQVGYLQELQR